MEPGPLVRSAWQQQLPQAEQLVPSQRMLTIRSLKEEAAATAERQQQAVAELEPAAVVVAARRVY
jgi:hypothetical protein